MLMWQLYIILAQMIQLLKDPNRVVDIFWSQVLVCLVVAYMIYGSPIQVYLLNLCTLSVPSSLYPLDSFLLPRIAIGSPTYLDFKNSLNLSF